MEEEEAEQNHEEWLGFRQTETGKQGTPDGRKST